MAIVNGLVDGEQVLLEYDQQRNALRLTLDGDGAGTRHPVQQPGLVDIGGSGRLIGVEIRPDLDSGLLANQLQSWLADERAGQWTGIDDDGSAYIELSELIDDASPRSCEVTLELELRADGQIASILIPRHGPDYEISYPSGNR